LLKNELKQLNKNLILKVREGKCGNITIYEMLKAVTVLDNNKGGQDYLLDHCTNEKMDDLLKMLKDIVNDMRAGQMNIPDLTAKYLDRIPQTE
jgi:hypothetical protein